MSEPGRTRCAWAGIDAAYLEYHDLEWGVPVHDDRRLLEMVILEGAQAGLSWRTILNKRLGYRTAFAGFDMAAVAAMGDADVERLLADPGIVRNRAKVLSAIGNARASLAVVDELGSLDAYLWTFVGGRPLQNDWRALSDLPARTAESEAMSRDLIKRGFKFVGPTITYAFMQAVGMVNDHTADCFRHAEIAALPAT